MGRFLVMIVLAIALLLGVELRQAEGRTVEPSDRSPVVEGANRFGIDLFGALRSRPGNVSLAPAGVATALAMTYEGARGETADEIARVLHLPADREATRAGFRALLARLDGDGKERPYRLAVADAMWGQRGEAFLPEFTRRLAETYGAEVHSVDFRRAAGAALGEINGWVDGKTNHMIPELLGPGDVGPDTSLVLVNAVYFKGTWLYPFARTATAPGDFRRGDGSTVSVPLMRQTRRLSYARGDGFGLLELPYQGRDLAFDIVLPDEGVALDKVEADLTLAPLQHAIDRLAAREVALTMPRFKVSSRADLTGTLAGLGMSRAFSSRADFSGIDGTRELAISKVVHQVVVNLDEEGTEAAAATGVMMKRSMAVATPPLVFRVDRPFLYLIRDVQSGAILFLGRVADPS